MSKMIDRDGLKFTCILAIITIILGFFSNYLAWIGIIITAWCAYFFRDPERVSPTRKNIILSPADGIVQKITHCVPPEELELGDDPLERISIFMSIFNVHVNRAPVSGTVSKIIYTPGKFFNATLDKSSDLNEREAIVIKTGKNNIAFVRIAGLIARRIRTDISEGDELLSGQRVGIIRFGSRVDIYLPNKSNVLVDEGQTMIAGETVLANY